MTEPERDLATEIDQLVDDRLAAMPAVMPDHVIVMTEESGAGAVEDRVYWECSCGRGGSAASWKVDLAVEKHIPEGDTWVHRTSAGGAWS